jgi:MSHA biogenesis protein MshP
MKRNLAPMPTQRGMAMLSAIFILVVLAMLGAAAMTLSTSQHMGSVQDLQSARALNAARSGLEWAAYQRAVNNSPAVGTSSTTTFTFPGGASSLADFTVTVTSSPVADTQGRPTGVTRIVATACNEPNAACPNTTDPSNLYIERQVEMLF